MTVVESFSTTKCRENYKFQISQIKEITGVDSNEAWKALQEGSFDSAKAIEIVRKQTQKTFDVIDLTDNDNDNQDFEKAIALSLQENNQVASNEQRDLSRALEESCNDSNPKRTRTDLNYNPHEQKRSETYPVGLRNVGNTCWFSAVVQSLFHIPAFRKNILQFGSSCEDAEGDPKVMTVKELQKLFAFMIGSQRKYIDPSYVIQGLTDFFKADLNQEDVSEFMIKLIDYLEGCFKPKCQTKEDGSLVNPVVDMFYGQYTVEGRNAGQHFTKEETFCAYPLQIAKYKDLHSSIEGAMLDSDIEPTELCSEETHSQEHWFTRLPAVLVLELSRFRFNQESQQPEKIHNKIEFEETMYMDRYMQGNKDIVRNLRKYILEELKMEKNNQSPDALTNGNAETPDSLEPMETSDGEGSPADEKSPADAVYETEDFPKTILYRLHAVLVHEGEANGGHYWAFIYDTQSKTWRKFNDITVSDVTWEEVHRVSVGGSFSASAYCLIYTDTKRATQLYSVPDCYVADSLKNLVDEDNEVFQKELEEWDTKEAAKAVVQATNSPWKVDSNISECENISADNPDQKPKKNYVFGDPSKILDNLTHMVTNVLDKYGPGNALKEWCKKEREKYQKRATENLSAAENYQCDVRLEHQAIYMIKCHAPPHVTDMAILETFLQEIAGGKTGKENSHNIRREAEKKTKEYKVEELEEYEKWENHHSNFQKANLAFITGLEYLDSLNYLDSLLYLIYAVKLNFQLPPNGQLNKDLLSRAVGLCLLKLNGDAFRMFNTGFDDDAYKALNVMTQLVIPSMNISDCSNVVDHIREQWVTPCVEKPRGGKLQAHIEDFMHCLFEGSNSKTMSDPPLRKCDLNCKTLSRKFSKVISRVNDSPQFLELTAVK